MRISGTGITSFVTKTRVDFKIYTSLAIKYFKVANGNYKLIDRGSTVDAYETEIGIHGLRGSIEQLVYELEQNRVADIHTVTLSQFNENEKIFGVDVVHTDITATMLGTPEISQTDLKSFETRIRLRGSGLSFTGSATMPALNYASIGYNANVDEYTLTKLDTYTGVYSYLDMSTDSGIFRGRFQFTDSELTNLRRYMATSRGTTTAITAIAGVTYPFGILRGGYPKNVKILELSDETQRGIGNWYASLVLAEVI